MKLTKLFNSKGFTMIEVMIIAALLGVMITTFASYQYQRAKQNKANENRVEYGQLQNNLKGSINQSEGLTQTEDLEFANLSTPTPTPANPATPTPIASPTLCPAGCSYSAANYRCEVSDPTCYTSNTCTAGCTIPQLLTSTTTATTTAGTTTAGTSTAGTATTTAGTSTTTAGTSTTTAGTTTAGTSTAGTGTPCNSTNSCTNDGTQCVMRVSKYTCSSGSMSEPGRSYLGRTDCNCPGLYIYPDKMCGVYCIRD